MTISVVVPTRDRPKSLIDCITRLELQTDPPDEVLVIVHESDLATLRCLEEISCPLNLVLVRTTGGACRARNDGIAMASSDIIVLIEDDMLLSLKFIETIRSLFSAEPERVLTGYVFDRVDLSSPYFLKREDADFVFGAPRDEFKELILGRVFDGKPQTYPKRYILLRFGRRAAKMLFLMEGHSRGRILPSGFRSEMPVIADIHWMRRVSWVFGGSLAASRDLFLKFHFNEELEKNKYSLNDDLEWSSRVTPVVPTFVCSGLLSLHMREVSGIRIGDRERFRDLAITSSMIAKRDGNRPAYIWSMIGLAVASLLEISLSPLKGRAHLIGLREGIKIGLRILATEER
jgi:glycosyltransferase involved in cell wall biosynthesis